MNLTKAPFDDVEFRRALTTAFDYDEVVEKAQLGYVEQASQTGLVIPGQEEWLPEGLENEGKMPYDADAADQALTDAGYELDSEGRRLGQERRADLVQLQGAGRATSTGSPPPTSSSRTSRSSASTSTRRPRRRPSTTRTARPATTT